MTAGIWYHRRGSTLPMNPGSRAQGAIKVWGGLSMNRPPTPSLSPSEGERVPGGRVRGVVHGPNACEKRKGAFHEPPLSRPAATLSPPCGERAGRGVPIWFMAPMRVQILEVPPTHAPPPHSFPLPQWGRGGRRWGEGEVHGPNAKKREEAFH